MLKSAPRILIAGTGSGCGKTTVVCAILQALINRGYDVAAYKCGPDYIDPMFHSEIIGAPCTNVDLFFADADCVRTLFASHASEINVIEGAMGYYDGLSMETPEASAWHIAQTLETPSVLVVNVRGMGLSVAAMVKGYLTMRTPSGIRGVILNQASPMIYPQLKAAIERECSVKVWGYMPPMSECVLGSRHLGLVTAQEIIDLREKMQTLAKQAEISLDLDGLIECMRAQPPIEVAPMSMPEIGYARVAVAKDKAFCFYYRDNLELLEKMGAKLIEFSPLDDARLPDCDGLLLGGGYPELYLEKLSNNYEMRKSIYNAVKNGLPTIAECGGFMYLTEAIGGYPMAGVFHTSCSDRKKLVRFGYATLTAEKDNMLLRTGETLRSHEFHYWDAEEPGKDMIAAKRSGRKWECVYATDTLYAGYPHLYLPANMAAAERFMKKCLEERKKRHEAHGN